VRVADAIAIRLRQWGLDTIFSVTGGGAMHLNDALANAPGFSTHYLHHEQACAMAAEGFARVARKPAVLNVTSGPGVLNALNGVFGAFTDSIPMVVLSGQVRRSTMSDHYGLTDLRQLGDQEVRTAAVVRPMVKSVAILTDPESVIQVVDAAVLSATSGRPGPAWIDVPVDVQGTAINTDLLKVPLPVDSSGASSESSGPSVGHVADLLRNARRPLILAGTGVRLAQAEESLVALAEGADAPVATAWTHDCFPNDHSLYAGRPGTIGTRAGNMILQACDLLLVLGSRLNIRQVSYNFDGFAPHARIVWVDVDPAELAKPFPTVDETIVADLADFIPQLSAAVSAEVQDSRRAPWIEWVRKIRSTYEPKFDDYCVTSEGINPYHFVMSLAEMLRGDDIVVCGNASACIIPFQVMPVVAGMRLFSNSGSASMGYDLPAALGAAAASPSSRVICLAGDGSLMMNLQELQTLASSPANIKLVVLANDGYLSIRQTQSNFFGRETGCSPASGLTFPDFTRVCSSFGLQVVELALSDDWTVDLSRSMQLPGVQVIVAHLNPSQEFEPRLKSRMVDGVIHTPMLDDMFPHLPEAELEAIRGEGTSH
jgi:acetolactate synthase I/II/III large subunit